MTVGHRLTRLAMDCRALHDKLLLKAQFQHAAEAKRIATELDQCRIDMESVPEAADTGVIEMGEDVDETKRTR
jgi:hypothetical protein